MDIMMHYPFNVVGPNKSEKKVRNVLQIDYKLKIKDKMVKILKVHSDENLHNLGKEKYLTKLDIKDRTSKLA